MKFQMIAIRALVFLVSLASLPEAKAQTNYAPEKYAPKKYEIQMIAPSGEAVSHLMVSAGRAVDFVGPDGSSIHLSAQEFSNEALSDGVYFDVTMATPGGLARAHVLTRMGETTLVELAGPDADGSKLKFELRAQPLEGGLRVSRREELSGG